MAEEQNPKKRILKHLGSVSVSIISVSIMTSPALAASAAGQVIGAEGGPKAAKEALNAALRTAKSKPAMSTAVVIVCLACIPAAGAAWTMRNMWDFSC
jgi:hypothetical protein